MKRVALLASLAALVSQPVLAEDYVFKGDCARASVLKAERTIDKLIPYSRYKGVSRDNFGNENCGRDTLIVTDLNEAQRSTAQVVFNIARTDVMFGTTTGCPTAIWSQGTIGTVTFTLKETRSGDVCELYIWSEWRERSATTDWTGSFDHRVTPITQTKFVTSNSDTVSERFHTPASFAAVP